MKELNFEQLENYEGGGDISNTIGGACAAIGVAGALKLIALNFVPASTVAVARAINGAAGYFNWW